MTDKEFAVLSGKLREVLREFSPEPVSVFWDPIIPALQIKVLDSEPSSHWPEEKDERVKHNSRQSRR